MRKLYENFHIFHSQKRIVSAETILGNKVIRKYAVKGFGIPIYQIGRYAQIKLLVRTCLSLCTTLSQKTFKLQKLRLQEIGTIGMLYSKVIQLTFGEARNKSKKKRCLAASASSGGRQGEKAIPLIYFLSLQNFNAL